MDAETPDDGPLSSPQSQAERAAVIEALIFVSEEPLSIKTLADVLKEDKDVITETLNALAEEFNARNSRFTIARGRRRLAVCHAA
jgi:chromosome segregation and condensation protein ScpB